MSDVKRIDSSAVNDIKNIDTSSFNKYSSSTKSNYKDMSKEIETVDLEDDSGNLITDFIDSVGDYITETGSDIIDNVTSALGKYEWYQDFTDFVDENVKPVVTDIKDVLVRTGATIGTFGTSLVEGVLNFGENIVDFAANVGTAILSVPTGLYDGYQALRGLITDEEWESVTKKMWEGTKGFVEEKHVESLFNNFYETDIGKSLKENSYFFDTTRNIGNGVGNVAGIIGLTVLTLGTGTVATSSTGILSSLGSFFTSTSGGMAGIAAASGVGSGTESSWSEGASVTEGLTSGTLNGLWEGLQFYLGGKIGTLSLFGKGTTTTTTNILNSTSRVLLDGLDGGVEGIVQPLIASIYKDGYYDEEGNYIEFKESDSFLEKYGELFDDYGGVQNILTNAFIGSGLSLLGEAFDLGKYFNNENSDIETTPNTNDVKIESFKNIDEVQSSYQIDKEEFFELNKDLIDDSDSREFFDSKIETLNKKGTISKEVGEYINNLFKDKDNNIYITNIKSQDLYNAQNGVFSSLVNKNVYASDNIVRALSIIENLDDTVLFFKIPKEVSIYDVFFASDCSSSIDPKYIDSYAFVDDTGNISNINNFSSLNIQAQSSNIRGLSQNDIDSTIYALEKYSSNLIDKLEEIKNEFENNELNIIDILYDNNYLEYIKIYQDMLELNKLVDEDKITLTNIQSLLLKNVLDNKDYYSCLAYLNDFKRLYNFDYINNTIDGFNANQIDDFLEKIDTDSLSSEKISKQEAKLATSLYTLLGSKYSLKSKNVENNLRILSNSYLKAISINNFNALQNANKFGVDQGVLRNCFKDYNKNIEIPSSLDNLIKSIGLDIALKQEQSILDETINIVKTYFPNMKKSEIVRYLQTIDNGTGVCSYASPLNALYMAFYDKPLVFKEIFGYDMYRFDNDGNRFLDDSKILADFYTFVNRNNEAIFKQDELGNYHYVKSDHSDQIYISNSYDGVNSDFLTAFIQYKVSKCNNPSIKQTYSNFEVSSDIALRRTIDDPELNKEIIKNVMIKELEKGNKLVLGVHVDFDKDMNYTMYSYNPETGKYDIPYNSVEWKQTDLETGVTDESNSAGHAMSIAAAITDGIYVSSWGNVFYIPYEELTKIGINITALGFNI